jgi:hypothetical protein
MIASSNHVRILSLSLSLSLCLSLSLKSDKRTKDFLLWFAFRAKFFRPDPTYSVWTGGDDGASSTNLLMHLSNSLQIWVLILL